MRKSPKTIGRSLRLARFALMVAASIPLLIAAPVAEAKDAGSAIRGRVRVIKKESGEFHDSFANAVVWLSGASSPPSAEPATVTQVEKEFRPRVLPVVKGQVVHFLNQDKVEHNVFSTEPAKSFDLGRYSKGEYGAVTFDEIGRFKVYCDIHKSMLFDILVLPNAFSAVTAEDGTFSLEGVPDGEYELNIWHIYGGEHVESVSIEGNPLELDSVDLKSSRLIRSVEDHLNKNGKRYKRKKKYRDR